MAISDKKKEFTCMNCSNKFIAYKSNKRHNRVFCSKKCWGEHHRGLSWIETRGEESSKKNKKALRDRCLDKHPSWKGGGATDTYSKIAYNVLKLEKICNRCKSKENICIHHKDRNQKNNTKENIEILCRKCHTREHGKEISEGILKSKRWI